MTAATNTAGAVTNAMNAADTGNRATTQEALPSIFQVQVIGYGMIQETKNDDKTKRHTDQMTSAQAEPSFAGFAQ